MPGVSVTVAEQIEALASRRRRRGRPPDPPRARRDGRADRRRLAARASTRSGRDALGFRAEADFEEIIRVHVEDELGGAIPGRTVSRIAARHGRRQRHRPRGRDRAGAKRASPSCSPAGAASRSRAAAAAGGPRRGRRSPCDVRDPGVGGTRSSPRSTTRFGRLDLLFNNAGIGAPPVAARGRSTLEQWSAVVETNLTGAFLCTQEAFRMMKRQIAARRPDHQQRLDLGARAAPAARRPTPRPSTRSPA